MNASTPIQDDDRPVRNPSVNAYRVGDDSVLYDAVRDQVFAVNALARFVWDGCDGTTTLAAVGQQVARAYDVSPSMAMERVREIVHHFHRQKLLHRDPDEPGARETTEYVTFGRHQVAIRTDAPEVAQAVRRVFGPMRGAGDRDALDSLGAYALDEQYHVQGSRVMHVDRGSLHAAVRSLKHEVVLRFIEARPDLVWLHAGAVAPPGNDTEALLFVGAWGSGKSTMVAALYRAGWRYLSDDMVPYDPALQRVLPFPLTIAYREPQKEHVDRADVPGLPKTYVDLEASRVQADPLPARALVFPRFQPDDAPGAAAYPSAEAAVALIRQCQNGNEHRGDAVQRICELADRVPSFRVRYNRQASILRLVKAIGISENE